ncbi:MAG: OsmC family protein [Chloroflexi bacterium]|uniref:OsmC family protein n=1 Tax=Candidatus Chlorohelix allophototropha TaxID=3003348 RepID=A0A8T7M260_9CHLR|nr:OsmC family protein [Chloroflexota bacterium]WJW66248.1 OsmC family protein [Chloroflexota bacterium L227-S17]
MAIRKASATWEGNLKDGKGTLKVGSGAFEGPFTFISRFENSGDTNPEELLGAAEAGCFSMALAHGLSQAGHTPKSVRTEAKVNLALVEGGFKITTIELSTEAEVPGLDNSAFQEFAENTRKTCIVSRALTGVEILLEAKLVG